MPDPSESTKQSPLLVAIAWLVVLLPTAWGLSYTVKNAMKLFQPQAASQVSPAQTAPATPATH